MVTVDLGYAAIYAGLFALFCWWVVAELKDKFYASGYWKGRYDGWNLHRRMIDNKNKTDEVFDYDKDK